jgi:hypothetical protein
MIQYERKVLWRTISALVETPAERVVLIESFASGLPPREIYARHPQMFVTVSDIYNVKRKLFGRLQREREVLRLNGEFISV